MDQSLIILGAGLVAATSILFGLAKQQEIGDLRAESARKDTMLLKSRTSNFRKRLRIKELKRSNRGYRALCVFLHASRAQTLKTNIRLEDESAVKSQTIRNLCDIAGDYERERDAGYAERDKYKRQRDVAEEQRDDYAKQGVGLLRETERLNAKVGQLESEKQGRDEHGRFLAKPKVEAGT